MHRSIRVATIFAATAVMTWTAAPSAVAATTVTVKDAKGDTPKAEGARDLDISQLVVRRSGANVVATLQLADLTESNTGTVTHTDASGTYMGPASMLTVYFYEKGGSRSFDASGDVLRSRTGKTCAIRRVLDLQADTVRYKVPISCFGKVKQVRVAAGAGYAVEDDLQHADITKYSAEAVRVS